MAPPRHRRAAGDGHPGARRCPSLGRRRAPPVAARAGEQHHRERQEPRGRVGAAAARGARGPARPARRGGDAAGQGLLVDQCRGARRAPRDERMGAARAPAPMSRRVAARGRRHGRGACRPRRRAAVDPRGASRRAAAHALHHQPGGPRRPRHRRVEEPLRPAFRVAHGSRRRPRAGCPLELGALHRARPSGPLRACDHRARQGRGDVRPRRDGGADPPRHRAG